MVAPMNIAGRLVGPGRPCFIIAEAGVNHNGSLDLALRLVEAAADCGADAVKFQTFTAAEVASPQAPKAAYQRAGEGGEESQYAMLERLELSPEAHRALQARCRQLGLIFLSTPFGPASADLLDDLDLPAFKIPSGEVTNLPFLRQVAAKGRPVILSTGMCDLAEVGAAVEALDQAGCPALALLHCVSAYPADPAQANLRAMTSLAQAFGRPVGFSDHTPGNEVALAAVALGAAILEKHFTLDRALPGPDHRASAEPEEFKNLVAGVRKVESALGDGQKVLQPCEREIRDVARRSLVAARDIAAGQILEADLLLLRRPGTGLGPEWLPRLLGRPAARDIASGQLLSLEMIA